jgi:hypothetical protein
MKEKLFMKLTTLAIFVMALGTSAIAQVVPTSVNTGTTPPAQLTPAAPTAAQAAVTDATKLMAEAHNPFTGKSLSVEQIQLKLEAAKLQTQTLEELLKQTNLNEELGNVPLRKAVEAAQSRTSAKKEELAQYEMDNQVLAAKAAAAAVAREAKAAADAAKPKSAKQRAAEAKKAAELIANTPAPVAPPPVRPSLLSVLDVAGAKSVVLDFAGATLVAADGENTPAGVVHVIDGDSVSLNGVVFNVRSNTLSRFVVSDPKLDPDAKRSSTVTASPSPVTVVGTPLPGLSSGKNALPPLPASYTNSTGGTTTFRTGIAPIPVPTFPNAQFN